MSITATTITSDGVLVLLKKYRNHSETIEGLVEIGGTFGGGELSLFISLSDGTVINTWNDKSGIAYKTKVADTVPFNVPVVNQPEESFRLYYTLTGSTTPSISVTIGDTA